MQVSCKVPMGVWSADADDGYITTFEGKILSATRTDPRSENWKTEQIGKVIFRILQASAALNENEDLSDICDADSAEMHYLHCVYFDFNTNSLKDDYAFVAQNLLYLDSIEVTPEARNNDVHVAAVHYIIRTFGTGCGLTVMYPDDDDGILRDVCKKLKFNKASIPEGVIDDGCPPWHRMLHYQLPRIHIRDFASKFEFPPRNAVVSMLREKVE